MSLQKKYFFCFIKLLLFLQAHLHLPSVKVLPQVQYPLELQVKVSILYLLVSHLDMSVFMIND